MAALIVFAKFLLLTEHLTITVAGWNLEKDTPLELMSQVIMPSPSKKQGKGWKPVPVRFTSPGLAAFPKHTYTNPREQIDACTACARSSCWHGPRGVSNC